MSLQAFYPVDASFRAVFTTDTLPIPGVTDSTLSLSETETYWRTVAGVGALEIVAAEDQTAGFINPFELANRSVTVRDVLRGLAFRMFAGVFQNTQGVWSVISRSQWDTVPIRGSYSSADWDILELDLQTNILEELEATEVRFHIYQSGTLQSVTVEEVTKTALERRARVGVRTFTVPSYFVFLPQIPGSVQPVDDLIAERPPTIMEYTIAGLVDGDATDDQLWLADAGNRAVVTHNKRVYTGMILNRRITGRYGQSLKFRYTMWVLNVTATQTDIGRYDVGDTYDTGKVYA